MESLCRQITGQGRGEQLPKFGGVTTTGDHNKASMGQDEVVAQVSRRQVASKVTAWRTLDPSYEAVQPLGMRVREPDPLHSRAILETFEKVRRSAIDGPEKKVRRRDVSQDISLGALPHPNLTSLNHTPIHPTLQHCKS